MDDASFREIVDRHWAGCYAQGYRLTKDAATAEDLAQDAFMRLHRRRDALDGDVNYGAYLRRTVLRMAIDRFRKTSRRREVALPQTELAGPETDTGNGLTEAVRERLKEMPQREAEVFTLRVLEGLDTRETAATLEIGEGTVRRYLFDAVRRLRESLSGWLEETS